MNQETAKAPTFIITREKGMCKLTVGDDILWLDETTDTKYLRDTLCTVRDVNFPTIPMKLIGCIIPYENGMIAAAISAGKLNPEGSEFIIVMNYMFPEMGEYKTAMFYVNRETLDEFVDVMAPATPATTETEKK